MTARLRDRIAKYDNNGDPVWESWVLTDWERAKDAGYDVGPEDRVTLTPGLVDEVARLQRGAA